MGQRLEEAIAKSKNELIVGECCVMNPGFERAELCTGHSQHSQLLAAVFFPSKIVHSLRKDNMFYLYLF